MPDEDGGFDGFGVAAAFAIGMVEYPGWQVIG